MSPIARFIQRASRSRRALWRFAFVTLALGVVLGWSAHHARSLFGITPLERVQRALHIGGGLTAATVLAGMPPSHQPAFEAVLNLVPDLATVPPAADPARLRAALESRYSEQETSLALDLLALCQTRNQAARERLEAAAQAGTRHAAHALGLAEYARGEFHAASAHFRAEGQNPAAAGSRRRAIAALDASGDRAALRALQQESEYAPLFPPTLVLQLAIEARDWPAILRALPRTQFTGIGAGIAALAIIAALAWMLVLGHLGEIPGLRSAAAGLCLVAFVAGAFSTLPTICVVIWQDDMLGFSPAGDFLQTLLFYIGGVGVREELCKLALFAPLLPWLMRRDDELEVLMAAGFVGLGFAAAENINYFLGSAGSAAAARFLTANFLHVALTGLNGLALYRACTRGAAGVNELLTVLGVTIIAHGLYNAFIAFPDEIGGYLSLAVYVLVCQHFFRRAHELRGHVRTTLSLTGAFVIAISVLGAAMTVHQMALRGPADGLRVVAPEFIGTIVLLVLFFREFDESLAA